MWRNAVRVSSSTRRSTANLSQSSRARPRRGRLSFAYVFKRKIWLSLAYVSERLCSNSDQVVLRPSALHSESRPDRKVINSSPILRHISCLVALGPSPEGGIYDCCCCYMCFGCKREREGENRVSLLLVRARKAGWWMCFVVACLSKESRSVEWGVEEKSEAQHRWVESSFIAGDAPASPGTLTLTL